MVIQKKIKKIMHRFIMLTIGINSAAVLGIKKEMEHEEKSISSNS